VTTFPWYAKGDLFLSGPDEEHSFQIGEPTRFVFIKFTHDYIHQANRGTSYGLQQLEYLIKSRETHLSGFCLNQQDQHAADDRGRVWANR
jgi:AraC family L-rhamnose operon regulatory protein RhaS